MNQKNYNRWFKGAMAITNDDYNLASEILSDVLFNLTIKNKNLDDNLIFISTKNMFFDYVRKKKVNNRAVKFEEIENLEQEDTTFENRFEENKLLEDRLQSVQNIFLKLDDFDKKLYYLHFHLGMSQRHISRESKVSRDTLNNKVKKIKTLIKNDYEKNN
jgi:RNA polymerase sigma factor (sigma-70 family)